MFKKIFSKNKERQDSTPQIEQIYFKSFKLVLSCNQAMNVQFQPTADEFELSINGQPVDVQSAFLQQFIHEELSSIVLATDHRWQANETVRVRYTPAFKGLQNSQDKVLKPFDREFLLSQAAQADAIFNTIDVSQVKNATLDSNNEASSAKSDVNNKNTPQFSSMQKQMLDDSQGNSQDTRTQNNEDQDIVVDIDANAVQTENIELTGLSVSSVDQDSSAVSQNEENSSYNRMRIKTVRELKSQSKRAGSQDIDPQTQTFISTANDDLQDEPQLERDQELNNNENKDQKVELTGLSFKNVDSIENTDSVETLDSVEVDATPAVTKTDDEMPLLVLGELESGEGLEDEADKDIELELQQPVITKPDSVVFETKADVSGAEKKSHSTLNTPPLDLGSFVDQMVEKADSNRRLHQQRKEQQRLEQERLEKEKEKEKERNTQYIKESLATQSLNELSKGLEVESIKEADITFDSAESLGSHIAAKTQTPADNIVAENKESASSEKPKNKQDAPKQDIGKTKNLLQKNDNLSEDSNLQGLVLNREPRRLVVTGIKDLDWRQQPKLADFEVRHLSHTVAAASVFITKKSLKGDAILVINFNKELPATGEIKLKYNAASRSLKHLQKGSRIAPFTISAAAILARHDSNQTQITVSKAQNSSTSKTGKNSQGSKKSVFKRIFKKS